MLRDGELLNRRRLARAAYRELAMRTATQGALHIWYKAGLAERSFRLFALSLPLGNGRAVLAECARARAHLRQEVHERTRQRVLLEPVVDIHAALLTPNQPSVLQHRQVLGDGRLRHHVGKTLGDLSCRHIGLGEIGENPPTRSRRQRHEYLVDRHQFPRSLSSATTARRLRAKV